MPRGAPSPGWAGPSPAPPGRALSSPESLALLQHPPELIAAQPGVGSVSSLVSPTGDGTVPDGFRPSMQLAALAEPLVPEGTDQMAALQQLLEGGTEAGNA